MIYANTDINALYAMENARLGNYDDYMSDRDVRQDIEIMRQKGIPIMSSSRTVGYWLAESIDEVESLQKELLHRADELYKTAEALRSVAI